MAINDWPMLTLAVTVAIAVAAAAWAYPRWRAPRPTLPLTHVAGAALIGLFGWEVAISTDSADEPEWRGNAAPADQPR